MLEVLGIVGLTLGVVTAFLNKKKKKNKESEAQEDNYPKLDTVILSKCTLSREEREFIRKILKEDYYDIKFENAGVVTAYKVAGDVDKLHLYPVSLGHWETVARYASDLNYIINVCM